MIHLGCFQSEWFIFAGGTDGYTDVRWFAGVDVIKKGDVAGTVVWKSPDWHAMPWWRQKRHQRGMLFFENIAAEDREEKMARERLGDELVKSLRHSGGTSIVPGSITEPESRAELVELLSNADAFNLTLELATSVGPTQLPDDLGLWEFPAVRPELITTTYLVLHRKYFRLSRQWSTEQIAKLLDY